MSASYMVDVGGTCVSLPTLNVSGNVWLLSGSSAVIGTSVDLLHANSFCNLHAIGQAFTGSGQLRIAVQCSDTDTSGTYTDPTSGLPQMPTSFSSGGVLIINSGSLGGGVLGAQTSGQFVQSGFDVFAGFQRPQRFARAFLISGTTDFFTGPLAVGFVSQLKITGSGGGFSMQPSSGVVSV